MPATVNKELIHYLNYDYFGKVKTFTTAFFQNSTPKTRHIAKLGFEHPTVKEKMCAAPITVNLPHINNVYFFVTNIAIVSLSPFPH